MDIVKSIQSLLGIYAPVDPNKVLITDISHWTGVYNFEKAKGAGVSAVIIKGMDGTNVSRYFIENYNGAKKAGMLVGAYTWLYKSSLISVGRQARAFADLMKQYPCDLPDTVDFEKHPSGNASLHPTANDLYGFVTPYEDIMGEKPMIYTGPYFWKSNGSTNSFWKEYDLWIANYSVSYPMSILPWESDWKIWQFSDRISGFEYGSTGEKMLDGNYWHSDLNSLYEFCGLTGPIEPPIEPPIVIEEEVRVTVNSLRIREQPNTTSAIVGGLVYNQTIKPLEYRKVNVNTVWARIENPVVGWTCVLNNGLYYTTKKDYSDIPIYVPPVEPPVSKLGLYRIKDDIEAKTESEGGTRPYIRNGLPSTVRLHNGKGFLQLSNEWMQYLYKINDTVKAKNYQFSSHPSPLVLKDRVGYHNFGEPNRVEQLTFSGNIVEVIKIDGNKAYIKTYFNNEKPPETVYLPKEKNLHSLVQLFTTQYKTGLDMSTDGRYPRTLIIANPGEQLWIDLRDIVKI